jgi:hypothetical protein
VALGLDRSAPRSFADDADDCIMMRSTHGSTEYKAVARLSATVDRHCGGSPFTDLQREDRHDLIRGELAIGAIGVKEKVPTHTSFLDAGDDRPLTLTITVDKQLPSICRFIGMIRVNPISDLLQ